LISLWYLVNSAIVMQISTVSCYFFFSGPNIFLSTLFWNTLSQSTSLNLKDIESHPYERKAKL
jgi:hypothetical protein